jgi:hypothetical protein
MKEVDKQYPPATLSDMLDHLDHAVKVAGIDHVGIGTDFDGGGGVSGFNDHSEALNVTVELLRRGYTEEQIHKIWGGNLLRVWRDVIKVATRLQQGHGAGRAIRPDCFRQANDTAPVRASVAMYGMLIGGISRRKKWIEHACCQ